MAYVQTTDNVARILGHGKVMVATDLHGNLTDLERVLRHFSTLWEASDDTTRPVLVFVGDLFHGAPFSEDQWPSYLGTYYVDRSAEIYRQTLSLRDGLPNNVVFLLGNHDHAHVGGPMTSKFYPNEPAVMERTMTEIEVESLRAFIRSWPILALSEGNVLISHAAAPRDPLSAEHLANIQREGYELYSPMEFLRFPLGQLLWRRGAERHETRALLDAFLGTPDGIHIHGHDVCRTGYEWVNEQELLLSTSFGLVDVYKRFAVFENVGKFSSNDEFERVGAIRHLI